MEEFKEACLSGKLRLAKKLYNEHSINKKVLNDLFYKVLYKKQIRDFITSVTNIKLNIKVIKSILYLDLGIYKGSLISWILDSKTIIISKIVLNNMMFLCGYFGRFDLCEKINQKGCDYSKCELINAFIFNDVEMIKKLYPMFEHTNYLISYYFAFAFCNRNVELIKWLRTLNNHFEPDSRYLNWYISRYQNLNYDRKNLLAQEKPEFSKLIRVHYHNIQVTTHEGTRKRRRNLHHKINYNLPIKQKLENNDVMEIVHWFYNYFDIPIIIDDGLAENLMMNECYDSIKWILNRNPQNINKFGDKFYYLRNNNNCEFVKWLFNFAYVQNNDVFKTMVECYSYSNRINCEIIKWLFDITLDTNILEAVFSRFHFCDARTFTYRRGGKRYKRISKAHSYWPKRSEEFLKTILWAREQIKILDYDIENYNRIDRIVNGVLKKERKRYIYGLDTIDQLLKHEIMYDPLIFSSEMFSYLCY